MHFIKTDFAEGKHGVGIKLMRKILHQFSERILSVRREEKYLSCQLLVPNFFQVGFNKILKISQWIKFLQTK